jgi:phosphoglycolate phosphatase-like HAD superfamily hydrolase
MKYKLAIFDFAGTLADTGKWMSEIMNRIAPRFGFRQTSKRQRLQKHVNESAGWLPQSFAVAGPQRSFTASIKFLPASVPDFQPLL